MFGFPRCAVLFLAGALSAACTQGTSGVVVDCPGPHPAPEASLPAVLEGEGWQGVIFDAQRSRQARWFLGRPEQLTWAPNESEIIQLEALLEQELQRAMRDPASVDAYARNKPDYQAHVAGEIRNVLAQLPHYRRQYVGLLDPDGKKTILLNAFPGAHWPLGQSFDFESRWREELVDVSDGGFWFWLAEFDPASGSLLRFDAHGEA